MGISLIGPPSRVAVALRKLFVLAPLMVNAGPSGGDAAKIEPAGGTARASTEAEATRLENGERMRERPSRPPSGMILIQPGRFVMGSPEEEPGRGLDETQHEVALTRAYYLSEHEVTQAEWRAVMGTEPSSFSGADRPVEGVSWFDCVEYCNALSEKEGLDPVYVREGETVTWDRAKIGYRLPTEAEWEFACRAGSGTAFCNGEITELWCEDEPNLAQVGWYCANAAGETQPVKGKEPNAWGLHDMHGNVWEWCWDFYDIYPAGSAEDPAGAAFGLARVFRGGSWTNNARLCRSAYRYRYIPEFKHNTIGFRVCMTAP